jgi:ABC-type multidrug transport system ATPase subunit
VATGLSLNGVTKRYVWRGPWIIRGADLTLAPGSRTSVVGSNGSGKSTLLRIAAGVTSPSGGTASIPRCVGYVPERQAGGGKFTGAEYLAHMGRIRGIDPATVRARGGHLMERLGVRPGAHVHWDNLSKGNRQKVIVAQAFLGHSDAIILDEPTSGLDREARGALEELTDEALDSGAAVLTSSPETDLGRRCDFAYRLVNGSLVEDHAMTPQAQSGLRIKRIELRYGGGSGPLDPLCRLEGVLAWSTDPLVERLILDVEEGVIGSALRMALDQGWSVEFVGPNTHGGQG